ncbi:MAG: sugar transferase [Syntrophales bacterium]|nr:sugar transferase [Syntrophales bacterium]
MVLLIRMDSKGPVIFKQDRVGKDGEVFKMPFIVEQYNEIHRERLRVLPGITGLWQLSGDRKKAIHENMDYDSVTSG